MAVENGHEKSDVDIVRPEGEGAESSGNSDLTRKERADTVDLGADTSLLVDISDALAEKDKVKFTVHTKTTLDRFAKPEMSVVREHEEFLWLHGELEENEDYAGFIIPPPPPTPDFEASKAKLQRLSEGEQTMTKDEFNKMKEELEAEYLATFKKTVAMHEVFLTRIARHPVFRQDMNFQIFLEYESDLSVRGKNSKERLGGFFKNFTRSADELLLSGQKDVNDFFEHEKGYLVEYHSHIKEASTKAEKMTRVQRSMAGTFIKTASVIDTLANREKDEDLHRWFIKTTECFEKLRKLQGRVSSDTDLKLVDTLRYYARETAAAKDLLNRRIRCLANYEAANKNLERARAKNKDVQLAEDAQAKACEKFEKISDLAKEDLQDLKKTRVRIFKKNLIDLAEIQLKHAKSSVTLLKSTISSLKQDGDV